MQFDLEVTLLEHADQRLAVDLGPGPCLQTSPRASPPLELFVVDDQDEATRFARHVVRALRWNERLRRIILD